MSELYWLTRVGALSDCIVGIVIFLVLMLAIGATYTLVRYDEYNDVQPIAKYCKIIFAVIISLVVINAFIPTTKEMYIIYGVGGTIDYIKQDSTANQLPHKVIEACDKFLEQELKEDNE